MRLRPPYMTRIAASLQLVLGMESGCCPEVGAGRPEGKGIPGYCESVILQAHVHFQASFSSAIRCRWMGGERRSACPDTTHACLSYQALCLQQSVLLLPGQTL